MIANALDELLRNEIKIFFDMICLFKFKIRPLHYLYTGHGFFSFFNRIRADHFLNLYCVVVMNIWHENGFWLFLRTHQKKCYKNRAKKKVEIKRYLFDRSIVSKFSKYVFEEIIKYISVFF